MSLRPCIALKFESDAMRSIVSPADGRVDPTVRRRLWSRILDEARQDGVGRAALRHARFNVALCAANAAAGIAATARRCLQEYNVDIMEYLNADLEKALETGS